LLEWIERKRRLPKHSMQELWQHWDLTDTVSFEAVERAQLLQDLREYKLQ
jgi:hypothetical protein